MCGYCSPGSPNIPITRHCNNALASSVPGCLHCSGTCGHQSICHKRRLCGLRVPIIEHIPAVCVTCDSSPLPEASHRPQLPADPCSALFVGADPLGRPGRKGSGKVRLLDPWIELGTYRSQAGSVKPNVTKGGYVASECLLSNIYRLFVSLVTSGDPG